MKLLDKLFKSKVQYAAIFVCIFFTYWVSVHNKTQIASMNSVANKTDERLNEINAAHIAFENNLKFIANELTDTNEQKYKVIYIRIHDSIREPYYVDNTDYVRINELQNAIKINETTLANIANETLKMKQEITRLIDENKFCNDIKVPGLKKEIDTLRVQLEICKRRSWFYNFLNPPK